MGINFSLRGMLLVGLLFIGLYVVATFNLLDFAGSFQSAQADRMNQIEMVFNK